MIGYVALGLLVVAIGAGVFWTVCFVRILAAIADMENRPSD